MNINAVRTRMKLIAKESICFDYDEKFDKITVVSSELAILRLCVEYSTFQIYHGPALNNQFYFELHDVSVYH